MTLKPLVEMNALFDCPATCAATINKIATIGPNFGFKSRFL
jgi:hypothetical protein